MSIIKHSLAIVAISALSYQQAVAQTVEDGIKMIRYEKFESAKKILTPLSASDPAANYYLGLAELGLENNEAAAAIFAKQPDDAANLAGLARIELLNGNDTKATALIEQVVDKAKRRDVTPYQFAADALNYSGKTAQAQQAIDFYKKVLEKGESAGTYIALGDAYKKLPGGGGEAMTAYENATRLEPNNAEALSKIGALWYAAKRYDLALENYNKAKTADPQNPIPYRDLASAYYYVNKFDLSRENIEQYLKLSDGSVEDQIQYVGILYKGKDYDKAISTAQNLINQGQTKPGLYGVLAYSQIEKGDFANALPNAKKYLATQKPERIGPADYINMGRILLATGSTDSATLFFNKGIDMDTAKDKSESYRSIAEAYTKLKTTEAYATAGDWFGKIIKDNAEASPTDYFYWGMWNYYGKKYDLAKNAFAAMAAKYPDQPSATYWRGRVAAALDPEAKGDDADDFYLEWLANPVEKKDPDLMQAYQWLALYYYNKKDNTNKKLYVDKILAIDSTNAFAKQLQELK